MLKKNGSIDEVVIWDYEDIFYVRYILNFLEMTNNQISAKRHYLLRHLEGLC